MGGVSISSGYRFLRCLQTGMVGGGAFGGGTELVLGDWEWYSEGSGPWTLKLETHPVDVGADMRGVKEQAFDRCCTWTLEADCTIMLSAN